ncbi:hypothetical protein A3D80_01310 [Candidatus Roizmanbacteria bacterium RIFCSPHIGHO2_02_FULL_40_13b]|nr:MAG: hypothetical protein A3D80_01310 [Candidatus Roizmanbacteria bacterium RIFCSPHIGHO2_02_FULL_40_13b]OGK49136.1 MAG: hypothetical protein A3A56_00835 [Candidatus Roizmanbacteria bacterium RIFCSPLOWO2_01_FULL_40_32]OGK57349.1 MAG: hypothetical protein A3H83_01045 [Candidatus Roizmanbacteria bacterium RIFCSPLOWO2_02_FULL_39_8]
MIIILTGPAASGKNTISHIVYQKRTKCIVIDVDVLRHMIIPHKAPWDGKEGKNQQKLGVENACSRAINFENNGSDVLILDVLQNDTAQLYQELLKDYQLKIVLLMPSFEEAHKRFMARDHSITEEEFRLVYKWQQELTVYDEKIDNTNMTAEECAEKLNILRN